MATMPMTTPTPSRRSLLLGFFAAALLSTTAHAQTQAAKPGVAIVIGGALRSDNTEVWQRVVDEAGGAGARIVVFGTAAGNPQRAAELIVEPLTRHGARAEVIPVAPRLTGVDLQAMLNDPGLIEQVRTAQGVFFAGGAQELIVDTLQPKGEQTEMLKAIWAVFKRGGVVAGTSAGAAIMSHTMFRDAPDSIQVLQGRLRDGKELDKGLGFISRQLIVDQHFLKRGRIGRLLPAMQATGYKLGLGIEENSAAVVRGDEIEVIGARGALLLDLSQAATDPALAAFNIRNVRLSYLDHGDRHDLRSGQSKPSTEKLVGRKVDPRAEDFKPRFMSEPFYIDMLGDNRIVQAMGQLIDSPHAELRGLAFKGRAGPQDPQPDVGFEFRLYKAADSLAWLGPDDYTVLGLRLDVVPVQIHRPFYTPLSAKR